MRGGVAPLVGSSALLPSTCTASTGPANVDGKCILGGAQTAVAVRGSYLPLRPVYLMNNVPYTIGRVAGPNYADLARIYTYTRLNQHWADR